MDFVENLIQQHRKTSRIRKDIDDRLLAYFVVQTQWGIYDFLELSFNISLREYIIGNKPVYEIPEEKIKEIVSSFICLLKEGMRLMK